MKRIERLLGAIDRFQQRHSVLGFPFGVVKKYGDDLGGRHAALLAHYGFLSLFPLLLVFITVLGYTLDGDPELQEQRIETLADQFPVAGAQIEGSIRAIQGSGLALAVGVAGTLWGGLGITQSFQDAMNDVWNIPRRQRPSFWWRLARGLAALLLIFQILTGMAVRWRWLVPGAAVGALGWSVLQTVGVSIVNRQLEQANLVYGVFAVVIVLLGWLYLSSQLVLYAAEIN
ncbi:MAG TPA: YhjD/YihY/BrkB family envelope integrity protein, partial [Actinomycetota bacterium]|nr:YhjD/YihY/BrkB family envelope integrity protein [Actinomycetota bacterium]